MRQYIIEPIFGHLKFNVGYRNFLLRGIEKVSAEFKLMCIGWNLKKMLKLGIKSVRIQDKMVQIKYMLIWQLQILLKREENYDPVEKLKLIPDRFQKSPLFYKISFFFCLVDLYSRTTCIGSSYFPGRKNHLFCLICEIRRPQIKCSPCMIAKSDKFFRAKRF